MCMIKFVFTAIEMFFYITCTSLKLAYKRIYLLTNKYIHTLCKNILCKSVNCTTRNNYYANKSYIYFYKNSHNI